MVSSVTTTAEKPLKLDNYNDCAPICPQKRRQYFPTTPLSCKAELLSSSSYRNSSCSRVNKVQEQQQAVAPSFVNNATMLRPQDGEEERPTTTELREADVIIGRGQKVKKHPGNINLHNLIISKSKEYLIASRKKSLKSLLLSSIIDEVKANGGRFVKEEITAEKNTGHKTSSSSCWIDVGDIPGREKISQSFRDVLHKNYRSSNPCKRVLREYRIKKLKTQCKTIKKTSSVVVPPNEILVPKLHQIENSCINNNSRDTEIAKSYENNDNHPNPPAVIDAGIIISMPDRCLEEEVNCPTTISSKNESNDSLPPILPSFSSPIPSYCKSYSNTINDEENDSITKNNEQPIIDDADFFNLIDDYYHYWSTNDDDGVNVVTCSGDDDLNQIPRTASFDDYDDNDTCILTTSAGGIIDSTSSMIEDFSNVLESFQQEVNVSHC